VFETLVTQRAMYMHHIVICGLPQSTDRQTRRS